MFVLDESTLWQKYSDHQRLISIIYVRRDEREICACKDNFCLVHDAFMSRTQAKLFLTVKLDIDGLDILEQMSGCLLVEF